MSHPLPGAVRHSGWTHYSFSSIAGTRYRRIREVAIPKTLGATKNRIASIFSIEFSVLAAIGGLVGGVLANVFTRLRWDGSAGKSGGVAGERQDLEPAPAGSLAWRVGRRS